MSTVGNRWSFSGNRSGCNGFSYSVSDMASLNFDVGHGEVAIVLDWRLIGIDKDSLLTE